MINIKRKLRKTARRSNWEIEICQNTKSIDKITPNKANTPQFVYHNDCHVTVDSNFDNQVVKPSTEADSHTHGVTVLNSNLKPMENSTDKKSSSDSKSESEIQRARGFNDGRDLIDYHTIKKKVKKDASADVKRISNLTNSMKLGATQNTRFDKKMMSDKESQAKEQDQWKMKEEQTTDSENTMNKVNDDVEAKNADDSILNSSKCNFLQSNSLTPLEYDLDTADESTPKKNNDSQVDISEINEKF